MARPAPPVGDIGGAASSDASTAERGFKNADACCVHGRRAGQTIVDIIKHDIRKFTFLI
jgi:hypothetical protein